MLNVTIPKKYKNNIRIIEKMIESRNETDARLKVSEMCFTIVHKIQDNNRQTD